MSELQSASQTLKDVFNTYVATLEAGGDPPGVINAMNELHAAIEIFIEASINATGWGNPFVLPPEGEETAKPRKGGNEVQVEAVYKLQIDNTYTFGKFVFERLQRAGLTPHGELDDPVMLIHELFSIDGWRPHTYRRPDLRILQSQWSVTPLKTTEHKEKG